MDAANKLTTAVTRIARFVTAGQRMPAVLVRCTLSVISLTAFCVLIVVHRVPMDVLAIDYASIPRTANYAVYFSRHGGYSEDQSAQHMVGAYSRSVTLYFNAHQLFRPNVDALRIDPGEGPNLGLGQQTETQVIRRVYLGSHVLFWVVPLTEWSIEEIARTARPLHKIDRIGLQRESLVVISNGDDPYFEIPYDAKRLYALIPPARFLAVRLAWAAIALVISLLILRADLLWRLAAVVGRYARFMFTMRRTDRLTRPAAFWRQQRPWLLGGIVLLVAGNFLRSASVYLQPGLHVEDASHYFSFFYGKQADLREVFSTYLNNYLPALTNLYAWLVAKFDVRLQPALYVVFSFSLATAASAAICFSGLFRNRWFLLFVPSVLGLSGMNDIFYHNTLTEQIYVGIMLLLVLLFYPAPTRTGPLIAMALTVMVLVWFGPYSAVAVPVSLVLILLFGDRRKNALLRLCMASALAYYATVVPGTTTIKAVLEIHRLEHFLKLLFEQIFFLGVFGEVTTTKAAAFVVLVAALFWYLRHDRMYQKVAAALVAVVLAGLMPYFMSIKYMPFDSWAVHTFVPLFFWLVFVLYSLERVVEKWRPDSYWPVAIGIVALAFVAHDNRLHPNKGWVPTMEDLPQYLEAIRYYERSGLDAANQFIILTYVPQFSEEFNRFPMLAVIGSRRADAVRVGSRDLADPRGAQWIAEP